jgi:hypothetical protein
LKCYTYIKLQTSYLCVQDLMTLLRKSLDEAHRIILAKDGGLTTMCACMVAPVENSDQFAVCCVNVGDSYAYVYSYNQGIREVTVGSHDVLAERDIRDAGGALGPVDGQNPELHNLTCSVTFCNPGDIVFLTTDGISDNFDPVVTKIAVAAKEHNCDTNKAADAGEDDDDDGGTKVDEFPDKPEMSPKERHVYSLKEMERVIHEYELLTEEMCSAQEFCSAMVQHVLTITDGKRKVLEDPKLYVKKKLSSAEKKNRDATIVDKMSKAPGKLDHASIVAVEVCGFTAAMVQEMAAVECSLDNAGTGRLSDSNTGTSRGTSPISTPMSPNTRAKKSAKRKLLARLKVGGHHHGSSSAPSTPSPSSTPCSPLHLPLSPRKHQLQRGRSQPHTPASPTVPESPFESERMSVHVVSSPPQTVNCVVPSPPQTQTVNRVVSSPSHTVNSVVSSPPQTVNRVMSPPPQTVNSVVSSPPQTVNSVVSCSPRQMDSNRDVTHPNSAVFKSRFTPNDRQPSQPVNSVVMQPPNVSRFDSNRDVASNNPAVFKSRFKPSNYPAAPAVNSVVSHAPKPRHFDFDFDSDVAAHSKPKPTVFKSRFTSDAQESSFKPVGLKTGEVPPTAYPQNSKSARTTSSDNSYKISMPVKDSFPPQAERFHAEHGVKKSKPASAHPPLTSENLALDVDGSNPSKPVVSNLRSKQRSTESRFEREVKISSERMVMHPKDNLASPGSNLPKPMVTSAQSNRSNPMVTSSQSDFSKPVVSNALSQYENDAASVFTVHSVVIPNRQAKPVTPHKPVIQTQGYENENVSASVFAVVPNGQAKSASPQPVEIENVSSVHVVTPSKRSVRFPHNRNRQFTPVSARPASASSEPCVMVASSVGASGVGAPGVGAAPVSGPTVGRRRNRRDMHVGSVGGYDGVGGVANRVGSVGGSRDASDGSVGRTTSLTAQPVSAPVDESQQARVLRRQQARSRVAALEAESNI